MNTNTSQIQSKTPAARPPFALAVALSAAVLFVVFFIGFFQKAVAAEAPLNEISVITPKSKDKILVSCAQLKQRAQQMNEEILADGDSLAHYTQLLSQTYSSWFTLLSPLEEQKHLWQRDHFKPIETSYKNLDASSDELYSWVDVYNQEVEVLKAAVTKCMPASENRTKLLGGLNTFSTELSDCQTSSAGYVADMKGRLKDWTHMWRGLEGSEGKVPAGYFQSLKKDSDDLNEASQLFNENAQLLSEHYLRLLPLFESTTDQTFDAGR